MRAVAVLAVLFFHAGVPPFGGGFLGVDVFFTLSGFLITGTLLREMEEGHFSLWGFWQRRVARIVPALLLVEFVVLAAWLLFAFPDEMRNLRGAAVATPLFLSNLYFWHSYSYFGPLSALQPFLHSWSLGVEEQFYVFYPLLFLVPLTPRRGRTALIGGASLASLAIAAALATAHPGAAFYLLPARFWELGLGGLAAVGLVPVPRDNRFRNVLATAALAVLLVSFVFGSGWNPPFPAALPPTIATVILLVSGEGGVANRLLALPPLRAVGGISYSLYLWHWPVLAFWRLFVVFALTPLAQAGLIGLSFVLATLSYFAVERPFRRRLRKGRPLAVLAGGALSCVAVAGLSLVPTSFGWHLQPVPPSAQRILAVQAEGMETPPIDRYDPTCNTKAAPKTCLRIVGGRRNVLLAGDSHAIHLWQALVRRFPDIHFLVSMQAACGQKGGSIGGRGNCRRRAFEAPALAARLHVDGVILASRWWPEELPKLRQTVSGLHAAGVPVLVVGPVVEYFPSAPELLARAQLAHDRRLYDRGRVLERERLDRRMEALVRSSGGRYFSAYQAECPLPRPCRMFTRTGRPFHFDYGHYTADGAREIVALMPVP